MALLDIGLPEMNGYEVARAVRADPECREVMLVALTGYGQEQDNERARPGSQDRDPGRDDREAPFQ